MKKMFIFSLLFSFALQAAQAAPEFKAQSSTVVIYPIIDALLAPEGKFIARDTQWQSINPTQKIFLKRYFEAKEELRNFSPYELRSWASHDHNELNSIARENGFNIQLSPFRPYEFGSLAILKVIVEWLQKGAQTTLSYQDISYKAALLKNNFSVRQDKKRYPYPIVEVNTNTGDRVFMAMADTKLSGFNLLANLRVLKYIYTHSDAQYFDELVFPCVNLNQEVNIKWLLGMKSSDLFISQALQQTKFKMDENGAKVESAVMLGMCRSCAPSQTKRLVINKPFYVWIERENCTHPIFAGYIDPSDWVKA